MSDLDSLSSQALAEDADEDPRAIRARLRAGARAGQEPPQVENEDIDNDSIAGEEQAQRREEDEARAEEQRRQEQRRAAREERRQQQREERVEDQRLQQQRARAAENRRRRDQERANRLERERIQERENLRRLQREQDPFIERVPLEPRNLHLRLNNYPSIQNRLTRYEIISKEDLVRNPYQSTRGKMLICRIASVTMSSGQASTVYRGNRGGQGSRNNQRVEMSFQRMYRLICLQSPAGSNVITVLQGPGQSACMFDLDISVRDTGIYGERIHFQHTLYLRIIFCDNLKCKMHSFSL